MHLICAVLALMTLAAAAAAGDSDSKWEKAYPPADPGMARFVLHLPREADEDSRKVEIIVGKMMETDGVNRTFFTGGIKEESVPGWGYPRHNVRVGAAASTLIGVPPGQPKVNQFVTLGGGPYLVRYNSRLPVVVYAPEGFEVRYRIWKAEPQARPVNKG